MRLAGPTVIIGAGPHGLAAAAHLRAAGVDARTFGEPLEFWRRQMPPGMRLRSRKRSSHIADPRRALTIDRYEAAEGRKVQTPNMLRAEFVDYGLWYQRHAVPDLDTRKVTRLERGGREFVLELDDGETLHASRVVVAAGLSTFGFKPEPFAGLPRSLVSHTVELTDYQRFAGRKVLVVGAGQSALEGAADLHQAGAEVEVLVRAGSVRWLADAADTPPDRIAPPTDVGGRLSGWIAAAPDLYRRLPRRYQPEVTGRCIRPAASGWVRRRVEGATISCDRRALAAQPWGERLKVVLDDGSERMVDHVVVGTGYAIDVRRYSFLCAPLATQVRTVSGYPVLRSGLESSVPGLHFIGAPAAYSFGPIMRFVVGSWYAAPALTRRVLGRPQPPLRFSF